MSEKSVVWGGEGWRSGPARHRVCYGVLSAVGPLGAAALQLCAGWQVGVWRIGEHVGAPGALEQVTLVVEIEEITISLPAVRRLLNFFAFPLFFPEIWNRSLLENLNTNRWAFT